MLLETRRYCFNPTHQIVGSYTVRKYQFIGINRREGSDHTLHTDVLGYTGIRWDTLGYAGIHWDTLGLGYTGIHWDTLGLGYAGIHWDTLGYAGIRWDTLGYTGPSTRTFHSLSTLIMKRRTSGLFVGLMRRRIISLQCLSWRLVAATYLQRPV
jgi:hypothetical protein